MQGEKYSIAWSILSGKARNEQTNRQRMLAVHSGWRSMVASALRKRKRKRTYHCLHSVLRDVESQREARASKTIFDCVESARVLIRV